MRKILVVDDEKDLVELVSYNLGREGLQAEASYNGADALTKLRKETFDLVVLDLMLPEMDGLEILRLIRSDPRLSHIPVILLTAKTGEIDKVLGLEMGADDYVTKPFSPRELIARIKALLRRASMQSYNGASNFIKIGDIEIDKQNYKVTVKGRELDLTTIEFKLLLYLVERRGRILTRQQLLDGVWGGDVFVEPRTVDVHITKLRKKIEENPSNPKIIKTKRGIGYYIDAEI